MSEQSKPADSRHTRPAGTRLPVLDYLSPGSIVIVVVALIATVVVIVAPYQRRAGMEFWIFTDIHAGMYEDHVKRWNKEAAQDDAVEPVNLYIIEYNTMVRRALAAFWSDIPAADMIEVERSQVGKFFTGPLEDVGFTDLTDRLKAEGIYDRINAPSFSAWTKDGRIFGLPHDVHPTLLCYRADIVEAAGIDVSQIETWDDFARVMAPLIKDLDGDGTTDRYLLNLWYTGSDWIDPLTIQAGGGTFNERNELIVDCEANARVISYVVSWCYGPNRIAIEARQGTQSGNYLWLQGRVIANIMPDWMAGSFKTYMQELGGKLKLMPMPAWEPGGRRTSVWGGTMLGIPKSSQNFEQAWDFAKNLYLSRDLARELFERNNIISPVRDFWEEDFYKQPDPYFMGQPSGVMFLEQAPHVPMRNSSPFHSVGTRRLSEATIELYQHARRINRYDVESLLPKARELLAEKHKLVEKEIERNVFLSEDTGAGE